MNYIASIFVLAMATAVSSGFNGHFLSPTTLLRSGSLNLKIKCRRNNVPAKETRRNMFAATSNPFADLFTKNPLSNNMNNNNNKKTSLSIPEQFIRAWNENRIADAITLVGEDVEFEDASYPGPFKGKDELERNLRLLAEIPKRDILVIDDIAETSDKVGLLLHTEMADGSFGKKAAAWFALDPSTLLIQKVFLVMENRKSGEANLTLLRRATEFGNFLGLNKQSSGSSTVTSNDSESTKTSSPLPSMPLDWFGAKSSSPEPSSPSPVEEYFAAWNVRDMARAVSLFTDDCEYDDTAFPSPFRGKDALKRHLNVCADCFPSTFQFVTDDVVIDNQNGAILARWHAESDGDELFFTRGCSFYNINKGKLYKGVDFVEPAVFKTGGLSVAGRLLASKFQAEPIRFVPIVTWAVYMYVVFFSDWFYGLPATALEQRTWEEVRDLSLNFFLVSPILNLPFAPVVHPMLEGVFNLLLSWAALFAGFLSDDRPKKPNLLPMLPMVAGMQFLTSAFLLPYLATRSSESDQDTIVCQEDLTSIARVAESRLLAPFLSFVGSGSILWAIFARADDFGGWNERLSSFLELLSIDRVGSSFLVDLAIFAAFQGWLVEDDAKRRGMDQKSLLVVVAKYIPFFGMATYLTLRDPISSKGESTSMN